jgi:hypothetical protein
MTLHWRKRAGTFCGVRVRGTVSAEYVLNHPEIFSGKVISRAYAGYGGIVVLSEVGEFVIDKITGKYFTVGGNAAPSIEELYNIRDSLKAVNVAKRFNGAMGVSTDIGAFSGYSINVGLKGGPSSFSLSYSPDSHG